MRFCIGDIQSETAYDDLGKSAVASVIRQITQESRSEQLLDLWNRIMKEETCGGAE